MAVMVRPASRESRPARRHLLARVVKWLAAAFVLLLALVGFLHLTRGTAVRHVRGIGTGGSPVAVGSDGFPFNVIMHTGAALTGGHRVELMLNGDGTYERLWQDLASATRSITLQIYYGKSGKMATRLAQILVDRARAGVRIFVLYDAFGALGISLEHVDVLRAEGIRVEPFRPLQLSTLHLVQNRSHVRGIVIDGRVGWTGGFGIDDKWFGDGLTNASWRETNVRFEGPAVRQLQAAFAAAWVEATGVLVSGGEGAPPEPPGEGVTAGLLHTSPSLGSTAAERFMALSIAGARRTLYVTNAYFAPDDSFVELLVATARRGVDVRVLTGGKTTDLNIVRYAGQASYERLLEAGVRVYEWQPTTLHAKTFVVDSTWVTVGSMNFDNRSLALNEEATLMVLDEGVGAEMDRVFRDDLRHAHEITAAAWRERPWFDRARQRGANLLTRLL